MRQRSAALVVVVTSATTMIAACGLFFDVDALGPSHTAPSDAGSDVESAQPDVVTSSDAATASDGRGPTGLSDGIALPDLDAAACAEPSASITSCGAPGSYACRFATPDSGRCEDCAEPRCTGLVGTACVHSYDCDSNLTCFRGKCTTNCILGEHECGRVDNCLAFGYAANGLGLCNPSALSR